MEVPTGWYRCYARSHDQCFRQRRRPENCRRSRARRLEVLRTEAGSATPTQPPAPLDVGAELKRMQAVIDDLLRERSQWKSSRPVGSMGVVEGTMIPMDVGTLVDNRSARMEAMIDEAGSKRLRVEAASSSVCQEGVGFP